MNNPNWWYYRELIQIVVAWRIESRPFDFKPSVVNHFAMPSIERNKEVCFFCPLPLQGRACACKILWLNFQEFKSSATLLGENSKKIVIFFQFPLPSFPPPYPPPPPLPFKQVSQLGVCLTDSQCLSTQLGWITEVGSWCKRVGRRTNRIQMDILSLDSQL